MFFSRVYLFLKKMFFIYFWERERERAWVGGGAERERKIENPKPVPGSELSAQSPIHSSNPQAMRSWPELVARLTNWATQVPCIYFFFFLTHLFHEVDVTRGNGLHFILVGFLEADPEVCLSLQLPEVWSYCCFRAHHHLTPLTPCSRMQHNLAEKSAGRGMFWLYHLLATLTLDYLPYLHSLWIV